jgi:hypothetical protein
MSRAYHAIAILSNENVFIIERRLQEGAMKGIDRQIESGEGWLAAPFPACAENVGEFGRDD